MADELTGGGAPEESVSDDPRGEDLASPLFPENPEPATVAPDEPEAETDELVSDPEALAEAEAEADAASSTRPLKRRDRRGEIAEAESPEFPPVPVSLDRPRRIPAAKDGPTARRDAVAATGKAHRTTPAEFINECIAELRKVVWPTGDQLRQYFAVVLIFVLFIIAFVGTMDFLFGSLLLKLLG